jgi:ABC-type uncharacterized transport system substrate-binding protein
MTSEPDKMSRLHLIKKVMLYERDREKLVQMKQLLFDQLRAAGVSPAEYALEDENDMKETISMLQSSGQPQSDTSYP